MNYDYTHQCNYCCHCSSSVDHRCSCSLSKDNIQSVERGNRRRTSRQQRQRGLLTRRKKGIIEYLTSQVYFLETSVENVAPQPHMDCALGFSNTKREPMMSSVQSIVVPNKCNMDLLQVYTLTPLGSVCFSTLSMSGVQDSRTYSNPLQPPPLHENNICLLC